MSFDANDVQSAIQSGPVRVTYNWAPKESYNVDPYAFYEAMQVNATGTITLDGREYAVKPVDSYGGEDMGTELWVVFEIDGRLFKKYGAHYSHDGSYWDGSLNEVQAKQKTVTVFE